MNELLSDDMEADEEEPLGVGMLDVMNSQSRVHTVPRFRSPSREEETLPSTQVPRPFIVQASSQSTIERTRVAQVGPLAATSHERLTRQRGVRSSTPIPGLNFYNCNRLE